VFRPRRGQSVVELALALTLLLTVLLGIIDFGRVYYAHVAITNAALEGARQATRLSNPCTTNLATVRTRVQSEQSSLGITNAMIGCTALTDRVTVTITSYPVVLASLWLDPIVGDGNGNVLLSTSATMPLMTS
jgi:Flp pilus assembly protein TadG